MYPSSKGNKINKNNPVMTIKGYDDNGKEVASKDIENITYNSKGTTLKGYLNGENISYLQVMVLQLPYKSSQTYNFGISELSLIAWPYALK